MKERFATLIDSSTIGELWTTTKVLMGLRYDEIFTEQLLQGVRSMKESATYQAIVKEGLQKGRQQGKVQEALQILLRIGADQFNSPQALYNCKNWRL